MGPFDGRFPVATLDRSKSCRGSQIFREAAFDPDEALDYTSQGLDFGSFFGNMFRVTNT